jgi:hypothetical protein
MQTQGQGQDCERDPLQQAEDQGCLPGGENRAVPNIGKPLSAFANKGFELIAGFYLAAVCLSCFWR